MTQVPGDHSGEGLWLPGTRFRHHRWGWGCSELEPNTWVKTLSLGWRDDGSVVKSTSCSCRDLGSQLSVSSVPPHTDMQSKHQCI
ncbi:mCG148087 [Mus musculus]|nr:mCG148087 [Mus musculus]